jgi:putative NADH-flavin reductase
VSDAVRGQDAVLVALGTSDLKSRTLRAEGPANVIRGMQAHGVGRIVVVSAGGTGDSYGQLPLMMKTIVRTLLRNAYADHGAQEQHVRDNGLDWVIVRPAQLNNGPRTGRYFTGLSNEKLEGGAVSRADVAEFLLQQVTDDTYLRKAVTIA